MLLSLPQGSSLGRDTNIRWLSQLHIIASGLSRGLVPVPGGKWKPPAALTSALQRPPPSPYTSGSASSFPAGSPPVRILFPSTAQVMSNLASPVVGGAFFAKAEHIAYGGYAHLLHQPVSQRGKLLMHAKIILALPGGAEFKRTQTGMAGQGRRLDEPEKKEEKGKEKSKEEKPCGWLYVGSHNLTRSAWGNLSGTMNEPKVCLRFLSLSWLGLLTHTHTHAAHAVQQLRTGHRVSHSRGRSARRRNEPGARRPRLCHAAACVRCKGYDVGE